MADLPNPPLISANGIYEIPVETGRQYLATFKGTWDGAQIELDAWNHGLGTWAGVDGGPYIQDAELRLVAPSPTLRVALSSVGGNTAISITIVPFVP